MEKDAHALVLLLGVLVLGADRRSRCTSAAPTAARRWPRAGATTRGRSAYRAAVERLDARAAADAPGRAARRSGCARRAAPLSPVDAVAIVAVGGLAARPRCCCSLLPPMSRFIVGFAFVVRRAALVVERRARQAPRPVRGPAARPRAAARQRRVGRALAPGRDPARRARARRARRDRDGGGDRGAARRPAGRRALERLRRGCRRASSAC